MARYLPLAALRAFEAVTRMGSFRAAASDLGLTPSGVIGSILKARIAAEMPYLRASTFAASAMPTLVLLSAFGGGANGSRSGTTRTPVVNLNG